MMVVLEYCIILHCTINTGAELSWNECVYTILFTTLG